MSVRQATIIEDCERCFERLFSSLASDTAPWSSWEVQIGFPDEDVLGRFDKPILYTESPVYVGEIRQMGGRGIGRYSMFFGAWDDRKTGSVEEINIMSSTILNFFRNRKAAHTQTFTITLGSTTYTDTTLCDMGIVVEDIQDMGSKATNEIKEFRHEYRLFFKA